MVMKEIDAGMMQKAFLAAAKGLEAKKEWINELNVFPVPDGDTGDEHDADHHVGGQGGGGHRGAHHRESVQGDLVRIPAGSQGQLGRHSVPAVPRLHERGEEVGDHHHRRPGPRLCAGHGDGLQGGDEAEGGHDSDGGQGDGGPGGGAGPQDERQSSSLSTR